MFDINTEANNGIHTKDGISVGMSIQAMYNAYGKPDFVRDNSYHYVKDAGRVSSTELVFLVVNNKIMRIYLNCKVWSSTKQTETNAL